MEVKELSRQMTPENYHGHFAPMRAKLVLNSCLTM